MKKLGITLIAVLGLVFISAAQQEDSPRTLKIDKVEKLNFSNRYKDEKVEKFKKTRKKNFQNARVERKATLNKKVTKPIRHQNMMR